MYRIIEIGRARVVVALEAPGGDRRVVDRAVEREVELDVPLEAVDRVAGAADPQVRVERVARPSWRRTFQWPGGVSDFGPSAQNSASTRAKSPAADDVRRVRLAGHRVDRRAPCRRWCPSGLLPSAPGEMSIVAPSAGSSWLLQRITSTACVLERGVGRRVAEPRRRAGVDRRAGAAAVGGARSPSRGPSAGRWPAGRRSVTGMPFWEIMCSSGSGCQRFGSAIVVPGSVDDERRVHRACSRVAA